MKKVPALVLSAIMICLFLVPTEAQYMPGRRPGRGFVVGPGDTDFGVALTNWFIQSSAKVAAGGEALSQPGVLMNKWYPATVPATVLGTLVQNEVYSDVFVGDNLKKIPTDIFKVSWWFRTEFPLAADPTRTAYRLEFDGINYRADIWLNGKKVAGAPETYGAFRRCDIDVTDAAIRGGMNVLAVQVFPPVPGEPTIGFVDWNPAPPDANMGIWRPVRIKSTGDVSIDVPFVSSKLDLPAMKEAALTVSAELRNHSENKVTGTLEGRLTGGKFSKEVTLEPRETRKLVFTAATDPDLRIKDPKVWWTHDLGKPELQVLFLAFEIKRPKPEAQPEAKEKVEPGAEGGEKPAAVEKVKPEPDNPFGKKDKPIPRGKYSDIKGVRFGIREVSDYLDADGNRGYKLNGRNILIRGGGWTDDLFLDNRGRKLAAEVAYARHMNLNALRLEGFWGAGEDFYDLCDANGILVMAGWSCQWEWESYFGKPVDPRFGGLISPEDMKTAAQSWRDQVRWLRNHPSLLVWVEASDLLPKPELEKEYLEILKEEDPTRPVLASAKGWTSEVSGPTGVKMLGPYDWVPPVYWYVDTKNGGAYGFNTETGPGPQVPPIESLRKMIPEAGLWPIGDMWLFHCSRGRFQNLDRYNEAMTKRLGAPKDLKDYLAKAQFLNYEAMRGMFEAFTAHKPKATGVIQWMYNAAWPKLWWQLFDYYLMPNGAFYGARKACSPVHILYDYATREVVVVNNTLKPVKDLRASIRVFGPDPKGGYSKDLVIGLAADEVRRIDTLPEPAASEKLRFVDLRLTSKDKEVEDVNFYCLSPKQEILDEAASTSFVTPVKEFADLTALQELPRIELKEKHSFKKDGAGQTVIVEIENPAAAIALMVEINVYKSDTGDVVLPVFWEDNFITLLPGEKRKIQGFFVQDDLSGAEPELKYRGWNLK